MGQFKVEILLRVVLEIDITLTTKVLDWPCLCEGSPSVLVLVIAQLRRSHNRRHCHRRRWKNVSVMAEGCKRAHFLGVEFAKRRADELASTALSS